MNFAKKWMHCWMTTNFHKKNLMKCCHFLFALALTNHLWKNGNRSTTFVASSSNIQYADNSISNIFEPKLRNFQKATRIRWRQFFAKRNLMNDAHILCARSLTNNLWKNGNKSTTFVASSSNIQCVHNSISNIFEPKLRNFQKAKRMRWRQFL